MHTHVAWVKIKPYSSLAAVSLSPASVHHKIWQPFSVEEKPRRGAADFTAFPNQARLETGARRRDARQPRISPLPGIVSFGMAAGFFFFFLGLWSNRKRRFESPRRDMMWFPPPEADSWHLRAFVQEQAARYYFRLFPRQVDSTDDHRKNALPLLTCRLWLRRCWGWEGLVVTGCRWGRGGGWLASTRGERLTPQELLRGLSVLSC